MTAPVAVGVVRTGTANLASVLAALRRLGTAPVLVDGPEAVRSVDHLVLPGVGALGAAMDGLRGAGVTEALVERIASGRPTLAVCLGLQILLEGSEESPGVEGLGVVPGRAARFPSDPALRVPQLGWNQVEPETNSRLLAAGYAYFAHSFRLADAPEGWSVAWTRHGGRYVSALERGGVLACQFHPELSGAWGLDLLRRWLRC